MKLNEALIAVFNRLYGQKWAVLFTLVVFGIVSIIISWAINPNSSPVWTGFGSFQKPSPDFEREKSLWDWMNLLIVPLALGIGAWFLNRSQWIREQRISKEKINEETLQAYFDKMTDLLLHEKFSKEDENRSVTSVARSRTLAVLRQLDSYRKGALIRFLFEAGLITGENPFIKLKGADITGAFLEKANLTLVNLSHTFLTNAKLSKSRLSRSNLSNAQINNCDFYKADLISSNMRMANLNFANLSNSALAEADLSMAFCEKTNFSHSHLRKAHLRGAHVKDSSFNGADLTEADLTRSNLIKTDLRNCNLSNAKLCGAVLRSCDLRGAILDGADLSLADLTGTKVSPKQLEKVAIMVVSVLPNGRPMN
jgi:uncharacterized protein YjbI with pentapeptide repeats